MPAPWRPSPKILLCDEATSALDPQTTASVLQLLAEINRELKLTIVLITHEMDVIRRVCDQVAVMDAGVIVEQGSVAEVFLHPKHPTTKRFVHEDEQVDEGEQRDDFAHVPGRIVRLTFLGEATYAPLLGTVARETGVDYSILAGRIDRIKDIPYGQLTLAVTGGDMEAAFARFTARGRSHGGAALMEATDGVSSPIIDWFEIWLATGDTLLMLGGSLLFTVLLGLPLGVLLFLCSPRQLLASQRRLRDAVPGGEHPAFAALHYSADRDDPVHPADHRHLAGRAPARSRRWWSVRRRSSRVWWKPRCVKWIAASSKRPRRWAPRTRQIITSALLPEARPGIFAAITVTAITLVSYTAMAGVVGARWSG